MFERNRIAETLRSAREKRGLSLEQAAATAGIPLQYVRLLEGESNVRVGVSDELYLIPFFRKYASFVGIDAEGLLPEFLGMVQQTPGEGSPPIRLTYRPRWAFLWKPLAVIVTIAIAVALMLRQARERPAFDDSLAPEPVAVGDVATPGVAPTTSAPAPATPGEAAGFPASEAMVTGGEPTGTPAPTSGPTAAVSGDGHELRITAKEEAWLALASNDQPTKQYLLQPEESRSWRADTFSLTVGNAGGITIAVDGRELPPIGRPGQVVRNLRLPLAAPASPAAAPSPSDTQ